MSRDPYRPFSLVVISLLTNPRPIHMKKLYDLSTAPIKIFKPLPGGDHNSSCIEEGYFESILDFMGRVTEETPFKS